MNEITTNKSGNLELRRAAKQYLERRKKLYTKQNTLELEKLNATKGEKMRIRKLIMLLVATGCITACGSDDESQSSKSLFSLWTSPTTELDLRSATYGVQGFTYSTSANTGCNCQLELTGSESSGMAIIGACTHYGPTNFCPAGNVIYDYTNQNAILTLCEGTDCEDYR